MRSFPLFAIARSHDGQLWEPLTDTDARALFDELSRCWELLADGARPLDNWHAAPDDTPDRLVSVVVRRLEAGEVVVLHLNPTRALHLRAQPRQYAAGPLDFALGPEAPGVLTRA